MALPIFYGCLINSFKAFSGRNSSVPLTQMIAFFSKSKRFIFPIGELLKTSNTILEFFGLKPSNSK